MKTKRNISTLADFKAHAKLTGDNRKKAGENWSRSWGMTFWENVWFWREYTSGRLSYRTGKVIQRHSQYSHVEFYLDGKQITKSEFFKFANTPGYMEEAEETPETTAKKDVEARQLKLFA